MKVAVLNNLIIQCCWVLLCLIVHTFCWCFRNGWNLVENCSYLTTAAVMENTRTISRRMWNREAILFCPQPDMERYVMFHSFAAVSANEQVVGVCLLQSTMDSALFPVSFKGLYSYLMTMLSKTINFKAVLYREENFLKESRTAKNLVWK